MDCIPWEDYLQEKDTTQNQWVSVLHEYEVGVWILVAVIGILSAIIFILLCLLCKLKSRQQQILARTAKTEQLELVTQEEKNTDKLYPDINSLEEVL